MPIDDFPADPEGDANTQLVRRIAELENVLADYIQRYGFTERARAIMNGGAEGRIAPNAGTPAGQSGAEPDTIAAGGSANAAWCG